MISVRAQISARGIWDEQNGAGAIAPGSFSFACQYNSSAARYAMWGLEKGPITGTVPQKYSLTSSGQ